jgi:hypothetical protein
MPVFISSLIFDFDERIPDEGAKELTEISL